MNERDHFWRYFLIGAIGVVLFVLVVSVVGYVFLSGHSA
jgi:hypothetical protein